VGTRLFPGILLQFASCRSHRVGRVALLSRGGLDAALCRRDHHRGRVLPFCSFGASSVHASPQNSGPAAGRTVRFLYSCSANAWMLPALRPVSYTGPARSDTSCWRLPCFFLVERLPVVAYKLLASRCHGPVGSIEASH
jgi:hypothetical protein